MSGIGPRERSDERGGTDQVLHDEIELALLGLSDVVDVDDVGVIDAVRGARFAQHPRAEVRLAAEIGANQLQRHHAIDEHVARSIDDAHSPFAEPCFEAIASSDDFAQHRVAYATACRLRFRHNLFHAHACSWRSP